MEKKFYEMPEYEVINLKLEGAILGPSDPTGNEGGGEDEETPGF